jgi:phage gp37-like protein
MNFKDIEDKIISEIKTQLTYVRTVETYAGQLDGKIDELPIIYPAAFVSYAGSTYDWVDGPNYNEICEFSILVCAKNLRGNEAIRKDTYGCYQLIEGVKTNLINKTFGLAIERLKILRVQLVYISKTVAIYGVDFQTNFDTTFNW